MLHNVKPVLSVQVCLRYVYDRGGGEQRHTDIQQLYDPPFLAIGWVFAANERKTSSNYVNAFSTPDT